MWIDKRIYLSKDVNSQSTNLMLNSNWIFYELAKHILKCIVKLANSYIKLEKDKNGDSCPTRY